MKTIATLCAVSALLALSGQAASAQTTTRSTTTTGTQTSTDAGTTSRSVTTDTKRSTSDDGATTRSTTTRSTTSEGPGASEYAPGHEATDARPANANAPGQVKKERKSTSASEYSPGHQEHTETTKETTTRSGDSR